MKFTVALVLTSFAGSLLAAESPPKKTSKEALQSFNDLVGSWRCTGTPEGKKKEFWTETMSWVWQFKGDEAWMTLAFEKGKYFESGELRYLPDKDQFQLNLQTTDKSKLTFTGGPLKDKTLTLDREDEKTKEGQRLVFVLLHSNRILYRYEAKAADQKTATCSE